jgi:hypothetical protein
MLKGSSPLRLTAHLLVLHTLTKCVLNLDQRHKTMMTVSSQERLAPLLELEFTNGFFRRFPQHLLLIGIFGMRIHFHFHCNSCKSVLWLPEVAIGSFGRKARGQQAHGTVLTTLRKSHHPHAATHTAGSVGGRLQVGLR